MDELFRNTLSPPQWAALAAVPPALVALYFLKLRRAPVETPSTYLWRKTVEDLRVNSLWQRLRQSLLLLLQLLVVALAALALLRPGWLGTELAGGRLIFLVDHSASMSTADAEGGKSRLEVAKEKAAGLIDQMERGMTAMIIAFADEPTVVQQFTDNTRLLRERLATISPTASPTNLRGALELAGGLANPAQVTVQEGAPEVDVVPPAPATLFVLSDGRFDAVDDFALGNLEPVYLPIGSADTGNLAVTALETRRGETSPDRLQAYIQVANFGTKPTDAVVEVLRGERLIDARRLTLSAGGAAGVTLAVGEAPAEGSAGELRARVARESLDAANDRLSIDDVGYAAVNDPEAREALLVTSGNVALEQALATGRAGRLARVRVEPPEFLASSDYRTRAAAGGYGLIVYDRCTPSEAPRSGAVYVGVLPTGGAWRSGGEGRTATVPQVIDWNRSHPLLASVELGNFDVVESLVLTPPAGATTLIDAAEGPLVAVAGRDGYEDLVIGFPILVEVDGALQRNTDWVNRHSFPTFWLNVLEYFAARQGIGERSLRPGEAVELRPRSPSSDSIVVVAPSGGEETLSRRGEEPFVFRSTGEVGVYRVRERGVETQRFAVNLFEPAESDVRLRTAETAAEQRQAAAAALRIGNIEVAATAGGAPARKELWKPLLVGALLLLGLEWWVYHRRVYV